MVYETLSYFKECCILNWTGAADKGSGNIPKYVELRNYYLTNAGFLFYFYQKLN